MSRSKRFIAGTLAGYGSIGANILFTLLSIPLALAYLDKEQFGLWALAAQINGYLSLIELGMANAILRLVADHKDDVNGGSYGSHILTSGLVFISQGALIACIGFSFSWLAPSIFSIPEELANDFRYLLILLSAISGLAVASRAIASPLWAFQRLDIINIGFTGGTLASLAALWFGLNQGWGVESYPLSQLPAGIGAPLFYFWICKRSGYFPKKGHWEKPKWSIFKNIFSYGKDVFLVQAGNQLLNASQIMIISRFIGLNAAATYAVGTKIYTMGMMFLANPVSAAGPGLTELYVRGENERFVIRYWDLIKITLASSTVIAVGIATGNTAFIAIWTNGAIGWSWFCSVLLAILIVVRNLSAGYVNFFSFTKKWKTVRYLYLVEAMLFVPLAIIFARRFDIAGVIAASLIAHTLITVPLAHRSVKMVIGTAYGIKKICVISFSLIAGFAVFGRIFENGFQSSQTIIFILSIVFSSISFYFCWLLILPDTTKCFLLDKIHFLRKFKK